MEPIQLVAIIILLLWVVFSIVIRRNGEDWPDSVVFGFILAIGAPVPVAIIFMLFLAAFGIIH